MCLLQFQRGVAGAGLSSVILHSAIRGEACDVREARMAIGPWAAVVAPWNLPALVRLAGIVLGSYDVAIRARPGERITAQA